IKDVAARAGVSTSTVSHVINNTRFVSEETRAKVLEAIQELNYYQNAQAKALVTGRSRTIGLIVSDITNPFFPELVRGAERNATQQGYDVFLCNTDYDPERTSSLVRRLIEQKVDGAIIMTTEMEYSLLTSLTAKKIPVVLLDWGITDLLVRNIK
ncbi:LacI family transcriptional regulator, partial [Candidatus Hakubella thermalkaliphila]